MTVNAINLGVLSIQLEREFVVREGFAKTVHTIVAGQTVRAIIDDMRLGKDCVDLLMAVLACHLIESRDALGMTVLADECIT